MKDEDRENFQPDHESTPADPGQPHRAGPDAGTSEPTPTPDSQSSGGQSSDAPAAGGAPEQPTGQYPTGQYPEGQYPGGQDPEGQRPSDHQPWAPADASAPQAGQEGSGPPAGQQAWAGHATQPLPYPGQGPHPGYGQPGGTPPPYQAGPGPGAWQQAPYGQHPPRQRSRGGRVLAAGALAVALVLGGGVAGGVTVHALEHGTPESSPVVSNAVAAKGGSLADVVDQVQPSVVSLKVQPEGGQSGDEGSGVIIRSDGMILTNDHVVASVAQNGGSITVAFSDGKQAAARVVGTDPAGDLAVVQAEGQSGLKPATLGNSGKLRVGDGVVAIGSPLGLEGSVTEGIVSALNRSYSVSSQQEQPQQQNPFPFGRGQQEQQGTGQTITIPNAIQTDAAINPGNSGGPLLNMAGQVVGINSAIRSSGSSSGQAGNIGIGFAIPINTAHSTAKQLMNGKKVRHALLGVKVGDAVSDSAGSSGAHQGALVGDVTANGPADKGGLKKGDVITKVDDVRVTDSEALVSVISQHKPGDKVTITYSRNGDQKTAEVTLGVRTD